MNAAIAAPTRTSSTTSRRRLTAPDSLATRPVLRRREASTAARLRRARVDVSGAIRAPRGALMPQHDAHAVRRNAANPRKVRQQRAVWERSCTPSRVPALVLVRSLFLALLLT